MRQLIISLFVGIIAALWMAGESRAASYEAWSEEPLSKFGSYDRAKISRDGSFITAANSSGNQEIFFFNSGSSKALWQYVPASVANLDLAFADHGGYLAASGSHIILFDKNSNNPLWDYKPEAGPFSAGWSRPF